MRSSLQVGLAQSNDQLEILYGGVASSLTVSGGVTLVGGNDELFLGVQRGGIESIISSCRTLTRVKPDAHCQQTLGTLHPILRRPQGFDWLWIVAKQGPTPWLAAATGSPRRAGAPWESSVGSPPNWARR